MYQVCGIWEINVFVVSGFVTGGMVITVWLAKEEVNNLKPSSEYFPIYTKIMNMVLVFGFIIRLLCIRKVYFCYTYGIKRFQFHHRLTIEVQAEIHF